MSERVLLGKNAIVTGARRGIGHAIVEKFAENGANIFSCARTKSDKFLQDMKGISDKYNVEITPIFFDLCNSDEISNGLNYIFSREKKIDILVNNAGIAYRALFQMTTIEKTREIFEVNFFAPYLIIQKALKYLQRNKDGASIINIVSAAGVDANSGRAAYGSSKSALACLTQVLSEELGGRGIRVNAIAPGIIKTDALTYSNDMLNKFLQDTLLKEIGSPEDVANMVCFLASDKSSFITGQILRVDGGIL